MYLLDTVVVSALRLPRRNPDVSAWMRSRATEPFFISVMTIGEIQQGIALAPTDPLRIELQTWLDALCRDYSELILPFGLGEAKVWGPLAAQYGLRGQPLALVDSMIAATALEHDLSVVTRNVKDFERFNVRLINPWDPDDRA